MQKRKCVYFVPLVQDDPENNVYPLAANATGTNETYIGRIRRDESVENGVNLWVVADNIRKGAATNAVQIAQKAIELVNDNDVIFLDASTSAFRLIPFLASKSNITVVTNGVKALTSLAEYGINTFVYQRREPMDRKKFYEYISKPWPKKIIRAKGITYFNDDKNMSYMFEQAGSLKDLTEAGPWLVSESPDFIKQVREANPDIDRDWDEFYGDKMVKIVFIGKGISQEDITKDVNMMDYFHYDTYGIASVRYQQEYCYLKPSFPLRRHETLS